MIDHLSFNAFLEQYGYHFFMLYQSPATFGPVSGHVGLGAVCLTNCMIYLDLTESLLIYI